MEATMTGWAELAACQDEDPELFFPISETGPGARQTAQAKAVYRLRGQTVELAFAEMKAHRSLRRLTGRGLQRAQAQVAAFVLGHNLLALLRKANGHETASTSTRILGKIAA